MKSRLSDADYFESLTKRFWLKVNTAPGQGPQGECWEWQGCRLPGRKGQRSYGVIADRRKRKSPTCPGNSYTHRLSWEIHHGKDAGEKMVLHKCDNPPCVRPDHLFKGTALINTHDALLKGRLNGRHKKPGTPKRLKPEPLGQRVYVSAEQGAMIRQSRKARKIGINDLAFMAQIDVSHLSRMERGKRGGCPSESLVFMLRFLGISDEQFGLASCRTESRWVPKGSRPAYMTNAPTSVYRHERESLRHMDYLSIRRPAWLLEIVSTRTDLYDAEAIRSALLQVNAKQQEVVRATGVSRAVLLSALRGDKVSDGNLLKILNYAESLKQQAT